MIDNYEGGSKKALKDPEFKVVFDLLAVGYLRMGKTTIVFLITIQQVAFYP